VLSIGRSSADIVKEFTNHEINIKKGDFIYFFSDGYADQFGGDSGKKFKTKPMKELIIALQDQPPEKQRQILENTIEAWRGEIEQVDDILVIGRRF
jgi:serine phosphatase RsbU (regulator of sigma subunit)